MLSPVLLCSVYHQSVESMLIVMVCHVFDLRYSACQRSMHEKHGQCHPHFLLEAPACHFILHPHISSHMYTSF